MKTFKASFGNRTGLPLTDPPQRIDADDSLSHRNVCQPKLLGRINNQSTNQKTDCACAAELRSSTGAIQIAASIIVVLGILLWANASHQAIAQITPAQYQQQFLSATTPFVLIDVRTPKEFASGHIAGAINISVQTLMTRLSEVPKGKPLIVYCQSSTCSAEATGILNSAGYSNLYDMGSILAWTTAGFPITQS